MGFVPPGARLDAATPPTAPTGEGTTQALPPADGGKGSLWNFSQEIDPSKDLLTRNIEANKKAQREYYVKTIREMMAQAQELLDAGKKSAALDQAQAVNDYIGGLREIEGTEIETEKAVVADFISKLEGAGVKAEPRFYADDAPHRPPLEISRDLMVQIAIWVVIFAVIALPIWHMARTDDATQSTRAGSIHGTVFSYTPQKTLQPVPFGTVLLIKDTPEARTLRQQLMGVHDPAEQRNKLEAGKGSLSKAAETHTDNVGNYTFNKVPPGDYFIVASCSDPVLAWFFPTNVDPGHQVTAELRESNSLQR
jgi:hypothetical protein